MSAKERNFKGGKLTIGSMPGLGGVQMLIFLVHEPRYVGPVWYPSRPVGSSSTFS